MLKRLRMRRGFTLAEVIVAVAIVAVLAATTIPTIRGRLRDGYEDALVSELDNIASAINAYRQDVGKYPPRVDYLYALPASPVDRCGNALTTTSKNNWHGPYITTYFPVPASPSTDGIIIFQKDTLIDEIVTTASPTGIAIKISGLETQVAKDLDTRIDGSSGTSSGQIQYSNAVWITLNYIVPTKSGAC